MPSEIGSVIARDGTTLRTRRWLPPGDPWAGLLIVHGLGEHSGRHERTGTILAAAGLLVHGWDHRGYGASGGPPCHVERWDDLLDDVDEALQRLRRDAPGRPVVLVGHSMGGLIVLDHATSGRPTADLLVLSGPGLGDTIAPWKHRLAPLLDPLVPRLRLPSAITPEDVCRDPSQAVADRGDPLIRQVGSVRLARLGFDAQRRVGARVAALERMPMPTLVVHGAEDTVVPVASSAALERLGGVTRRVLPGLRHETFNEPEGPEVLTGIIGWIGDHVAASAIHSGTATAGVQPGSAQPGSAQPGTAQLGTVAAEASVGPTVEPV